MKSDYKTAIIVNPAAGGGKSWRLWQSLEDEFHRKIPNLLTRFSSHPGEIIDIATNLLNEGVTHLATFGGDGTFNEALQARRVRDSCD